MTGISDLVARMQANPDRGTPCQSCGVKAKDCQITFLTHDHRCCEACDERGGGESHSSGSTMLTILINGEAS